MAVHSILRFVRSYTSLTEAIPVGVVLRHDGIVAHASYVGFKAVEKDEPVRGIRDSSDRMLVDLTIEKIRACVESRTALHEREPSDPWTNRWWQRMSDCLVHSLSLTEPRAIDLPASDSGLDILYQMTMRPFRIPAVVPDGAFTDMYAELRDGKYEHFYPSVMAVKMCSPKGPIHRVRVRRDEGAGSHWGWWEAEKQVFTMIWGSRMQVDMCFTYGSDAAERIGNGLVCRLAVEKIGDAGAEDK